MSNITISNSSTVARPPTLTALDVSNIQAPAHLCWTIIGALGAICNCIIFVTIVKSKHLHTKSQFLMASLALADFCRSCSFSGTGLKRYLIFVRQRPEVIDPLFCALQSSPLAFFALMSSDLKLALSIDRLLAMRAPHFYTTRRKKSYVAFINAVILIHAALNSGLALIGYNAKLTLSVCTALSSFNAWYTPYSSMSGILITILTIAIYVGSLYLLRRKIVQMNTNTTMSEFQLKREKKSLELGVFRSMIGVLIGFILTTAVGSTAYFVLPYVSTETSVILAPFLALSYIFDCTSHLVIYLLLNRGFRKALISLVRSGGGATVTTSKVHNLGSNTGGNQ